MIHGLVRHRKRLFALIFITAAVCCPPLLAKPQLGAKGDDLATLDGHVVNATTGKPVHKAQVKLAAYGRENQVELVATSDAAGHFRFADVSAGSYKLTCEKACEKAGYLDTSLGADKPGSSETLLKVAAADRMQDLTLKIWPAGSISGSVTDANGDPEAGSTVEVWRRETKGKSTSFFLVDNTSTNPEGEYTFDGLWPGMYFVSAGPDMGTTNFQKKLVDNEGKVTKVHDFRTFYPSALSFAQAEGISLQAGQKTEGCVIQVRRVQGASVTGRLADEIVRSGNSRVYASVREGATLLLYGKLLSNGDFSFDGLPPGRYRLGVGGNLNDVGRADVTVGEQNLSGIVITPYLPARVSVRVVMEGEEDKPLTNGTVLLTAVGEGAITLAFQPQSNLENTAFVAGNVTPGNYQIAFNNHGKSYLKAVRSGNQNLDSESVDVPEGGNLDLTLIYSRNGASLNGDVEVPQDFVMSPIGIFLVRSGELQIADLDQFLRFSKDDLQPGKYLVFAAQEDDGELWRNPQFLNAIETEGSTVELAEKQRKSVHLKLIGKDTSDRIRRQLGL